MIPEQIERLRNLVNVLETGHAVIEVDEGPAIRALLAEWEELQRANEGMVPAYEAQAGVIREGALILRIKQLEKRAEERGREIERLRASTLPDVVPEDADALKAEIERSHKAILALTGEIERLKDEYTQILIHQDTFQQAEVERLKNEIAWQEERNANNVRSYTKEIGRLKTALKRHTIHGMYAGDEELLRGNGEKS